MPNDHHDGYDEALTARLLAAQGYEVPPEDLTEIAERVQEAHRFAAGWDAFAPEREEPWSPLEIAHG